MLTDLVELIKNIALRHKGVKTFRYQDTTLNNAQNNYATYQFYLDTTQYHELNITTNIFKVELNAYILGQPQQKEQTILDIQDDAYQIACDILAYIDVKDEYRGIVSLYDYSIMTIDHYSSDDSAGVRLSIVLAMPSPVNLCELDDNFNDEPYPEPTEPDIDVPEREDNDITIKKVKLPKNPC